MWVQIDVGCPGNREQVSRAKARITHLYLSIEVGHMTVGAGYSCHCSCSGAQVLSWFRGSERSDSKEASGLSERLRQAIPPSSATATEPLKAKAW